MNEGKQWEEYGNKPECTGKDQRVFHTGDRTELTARAEDRRIRKIESMNRIFQFMPLPEFLIMQSLNRLASESAYEDGRVEIRRMADKLQLSVSRLYKIVRRLQEKGYLVKMSVEGNPEGAFLLLSDRGKNLLKEQEQTLQQYGRDIADEYGEENIRQLLKMLQKLEEVAVRRAESMPSLENRTAPESENVPEGTEDTPGEDMYCLIAEAQRITAEVSLDLKENKRDSWERQLLETEVKRLRSRLENLTAGQISGEEIREIRNGKEQVERDAARLFQTGKYLSRRREDR